MARRCIPIRSAHRHSVGASPLGSRRIVPSCLGRCSASPAPTDGGVSCGSAWRGFARHAASDDRDVMPLYPADIFPHPSAVQEQGGGPLIQYWRFSIGGVVISRAAPEMQTDWQLSFKSGSLCLCHHPAAATRQTGISCIILCFFFKIRNKTGPASYGHRACFVLPPYSTAYFLAYSRKRRSYSSLFSLPLRSVSWMFRLCWDISMTLPAMLEQWSATRS